MKKILIDNLYQSDVTPQNTNVLWVQLDNSTGEIESIARFKDGMWQPYLVSVDYFKTKKSTKGKN